MAEPVTCDQATELLAVSSLGALDGADRVRLDQHVSGCDHCRRIAAHNAGLVSLLPTALEPQPAPIGLRRRLMTAVYAEANARPRRRAWWRRAIDAIPANRGVTALSTATAMVAVAALVWVSTGHGPAGPAGQVSYPVVGTTVQPGATGSLVYDPTTSVAVLTVDDLPAPGGATGSVYEVWLIPEHGAAKPVAFLTRAPGTATWTAVVSGGLTGYRSVAATVEPAGGSDAPTGSQVFSGQLDGS